eukprot:TRINITY_DN437_c0_g4_i1.p1 TRINITY_DN437_c0_g4~~TRINITY_DN437_c0_g4_i1.p1  ORF type:complete len:435 (+),score=99.92 TRINITY_DN437_c0_g4_i1:159-1463(+)
MITFEFVKNKQTITIFAIQMATNKTPEEEQDDKEWEAFKAMIQPSEGGATGWTENVDDIPLFMSKLPDDPSSNPALAALQSIVNDSAYEDAISEFKNSGNVLFQKGKEDPKFYQQAVDEYSKAVGLFNQMKKDFVENDKSKKKIFETISIVHSNRAAASLMLGNYGKVVFDCKLAIEYNPSNIKAYYRAAKAANMLEKYALAIEFGLKGLKVDSESKDLLAEMDIAKKGQEEEKKKEIARQVRLRREQEAERARKEQEEKTMKMLVNKGIATGNDEEITAAFNMYFSRVEVPPTIYLDVDSYLHFPVIFFYPEHAQSDFIPDFCSENTFLEHLQRMFPSKGSKNKEMIPEWDSDKKYVIENLEIYFETSCCAPLMLPKDRSYNPEDRKYTRVRHETKLEKVLTHKSYVMPKYPVFYIVVNPSSFRDQFLTHKKQ